MEKEVIIDVNNFEEVGSKKYYTIDEISKIINIPQSKIIYYCNKFNDYLNIQTVGMYQIFDYCDLDNLKRIKELNIDKKMNISEIKKYLREHSQEVIVRKEQSIDISFIEVFAKIIENQNNKMESILINYNKMVDNQKSIMELLESQSNYIENLNKNIGESSEKLKDEVVEQMAITVDKKLDEKLSDVIERLDAQEQQAKERDEQLVDRLHRKMEERQLQQEYKQLQQKKSIFSRLFSSK